MVCPSCNQPIADGSKFCSQCGIVVKDLSFEEKIKKSITFLEENRLKEADEILFELAKEYPDNHVVLNNVGILHLKFKNKKEARNCFRQALKLSPDYSVARKNLRGTYPIKVAIALLLFIIGLGTSIYIYPEKNTPNEVAVISKIKQENNQTKLAEPNPNPSVEKQEPTSQAETNRKSAKEEDIISKIGEFNDPNVKMIAPPYRIATNVDYMGFSVTDHLKRYDLLDKKDGSGFKNYMRSPDNDGTIVEFQGININNQINWTSKTTYYLTSNNDIEVIPLESNIDGWVKTNQSAHIVMPSDLSVGNTWTWTYNNQDNSESNTCKIVGFADVSTPAGIYKNCLVIQTLLIDTKEPDLNNITTDFYSPAVGLVKSDLTEHKKTSTGMSLRYIGPTIPVN